MPDSSFERPKLAYRIDEAVKVSSLGRSFLYEQIASGDLPSVKIGGRRLILHDDLVKFLTRATVPVAISPAVQSPRSAPKRTKATAVRGQIDLPW